MTCVRRNIFVREIDMRFDMGESFDEEISQFANPAGELSGELFVGGA